MKKSLMMLALGLCSLVSYAQDDDVYFVPSSKQNKTAVSAATKNRSSYEGRTSQDQSFDLNYAQSDWANGRGNGGRDVDEYNRRGKNYKGEVLEDTLSSRDYYDQGYDDGYEDGSYTARIVRFWSPRPGVYVSSPYYMDYYDLCYDPWYYGYGSPWSWSWSGWYGWGSWYGWRPYYAGWSWGWSWGWGGWYDPWWGGPYYAWGGGWRPGHWAPAGSRRGPVGGWRLDPNAGSNRSYASDGRSYVGRRTPAFGTTSGSSLRRGFDNGNNGRTSNRSFFNRSSRTTTTTPSRSFGNTNNTPSRSFDNSRSTSAPSRSFSQPSRSFDSGNRGFGGGGRSSGGGGGRSFGGRR